MISTPAGKLPLDTRTALALVAPSSQSAAIDEIRRSHDKAFKRWMPHINLFFPYVSVEHFARHAEALSKIFAEEEAFTESLVLTFKGVQHFTQRRRDGVTYTFHLAPDEASEARLQRLYARVCAALPEVHVKRTDWSPHLTLAQCGREDFTATEDMMQQWFASRFQPLQMSAEAAWTLRELSLLSRSPETADRMTLHSAVSLASA